MQFIDTHCHIIPGVDDGPGNADVSLEMARLAVADGIGTVVATPHVVEGYYLGEDRELQLRRLRSLFTRENLDLNLVAGAEVPMSLCASGDENLLKRLSIGGRYLLMEPSETSMEQLAKSIYQVRLCGLYPVLAHPERYSFAHNQISALAQLLGGNDVYIQVTVAAIEGLFGKRAQRAWEQLAAAGIVHLIGTDAHSARLRAPLLSASYEKLSRLAGDEAARVIMLENPVRMLAGERLAWAKPSPKRGFWPGHFARRKR